MPMCDDYLRVTNLLFKANHYDWLGIGVPRAISNPRPPERLRSEAGSCFEQAFPPLRLDQSPDQISDWARSACATSCATSCARASAVKEHHVLRLVIGRCIEDYSQTTMTSAHNPFQPHTRSSIVSIAKRVSESPISYDHRCYISLCFICLVFSWATIILRY